MIVKQTDGWIFSQVMDAYHRIPPDIVDAARRQDNETVLHHHVSKATGIDQETVRQVLTDPRRSFFTTTHT